MDLLKSSLNDIVFEKRNKSYGAYLLRVLYSKHILIALVASLSVFTIGLSGPVIYEHLFPHKQVEEKLIIETVDLMKVPSVDPEYTPPPPLPKIEIPKVETIKYIPPVVVEDDKVKPDEVPPTVDDMKNAVISNVTQHGDTNLNNAVVEEGKPGGNVLGDAKGEENFVPVSRDAGFPDMVGYIRKNIRYPEVARRMGSEGKVFVTVTISPEGKLVSATVSKGLVDESLNKEALRVVETMKEWQPALQNGHPIKRTFKIPISFDLDEAD